MAKKKTEQESAAVEPEGAVQEPEVVGPEGAAQDPEVVEPEESSALELELEASRQEASQNRDLYLRAVADMDNFRKRSQREREELAKYANENILREIIPAIDNLERAVEHARAGEASQGGLLEGVEMTLSQFGKVLEKFGVKAFASLGEPFDPSKHEAMGQLETPEHAPNSVAQEMQKGYLLNDRLLRPALVMVSKAPAAQGGESDK